MNKEQEKIKEELEQICRENWGFSSDASLISALIIFIEKLFHQARLNALEEVEKRLPDILMAHTDYEIRAGSDKEIGYLKGQNDCLSQIKQILKSLKN